jgi:hypothetical protein
MDEVKNQSMPSENASETIGVAKPRGRKITLLLIWLVICSGLLTSCVVAVRKARDEARCQECYYKLKQIELGLLCYESSTGSLPPAYLVDEDGKPLHSWETLVMPYYSYPMWPSCYSLREPWDGPNNRQAPRHFINLYQCPSGEHTSQEIIDFVAVVGPETLWPGKDRVKLPKQGDGNQDTILLIELPDSDIRGLEPRCPTVDEFLEKIKSPTGKGIRTIHAKGLAYVTVGGEVRWFPPDTDPESIRKLFVRDPACKVLPAVETRRYLENWEKRSNYER